MTAATVGNRSTPAARLRTTGGMGAGTALRLALTGTRVDTIRIALTAFGGAVATLGLLSVATVLSITTDNTGLHRKPPYTNALLADSGLRPGLTTALVLLTIPVLFFVAQCSRIGAPARDRRLAAYRMTGTTPRQTAWIVAIETGVATVFGVVLGAGGYFSGRVLLDHPNAAGQRSLPTDVPPPPVVLAAILAGVPLLTMAISLILLRRVAITPFGVIRRVRQRVPRAWPSVLLGLGLAGFGLAVPTLRFVSKTTNQRPPVPLMMLITLLSTLLLAAGLLFGTAWLSGLAARIMHRRTRSASGLISARQLLADPWSGSRTISVMLVALLFGAGSTVIRNWMMTDLQGQQLAEAEIARKLGQPTPERVDTSFYQGAFDLIDLAVVVAIIIAVASLLVVMVEGVVSRRRQLTVLVATGTPRGVLARASLIQILLSVLPGVVLASGAGALAGWLFMPTSRTSMRSGACKVAAGDPATSCQNGSYMASHMVTAEATVELPVPVSWGHVVLLAGVALLAVLLAIGISLLFLRASTDVAELRSE